MAVSLRKICCQNCGADLDFPDGVRFLTCKYCSSKLEVVETETTLHTRLLEQVVENSRAVADNLRVIEIQNDIERLDRGWEQLREGYVTYGKDGQPSLPSGGRIVFQALTIFVAFIAFLVLVARPHSGPIMFFPLLMILVLGIQLSISIKRLSEYEKDYGRYHARRNHLMRALQQERSSRDAASRPR